MVIFGLVGMGYEITESMMLGNVFAGIARGIFVAHIMYQFIMGHYYVSDLISVIMGETENAGVSGLTSYAEMTNSQNIGIIVCVPVMILLNLFCLIWGLKLATNRLPIIFTFLQPATLKSLLFGCNNVNICKDRRCKAYDFIRGT